MVRALAASFVVAAAACGGPALHNVQLINKTPRTIAEIYVFPAGAANHGASRGTLAPNATQTIRVRGGNVEVLAVSEKIRVSDRESETKQASSTIQLVRPVQLIFHDSDQPPPDLANKDAIGVTFRVSKPPAPPPDEPAPEAP